MSTPPTITNKNLPAPQQATSHPSIQPPLDKEVAYQDIVAKPLRPPNFMNMKHVNPNVSLFWGNRAVGEKESGLRYDQLIAMGFVPVKPDEVRQIHEGKLIPCPPSIARDGRVLYGDLILLKISRADYIGSQKWNEQTARLRVKKPGVAIDTGASRDIGGREVLNAEGGRVAPGQVIPDFKGKVQPYVPTFSETDAKTADNSGPTEKISERDRLKALGVPGIS